MKADLRKILVSEVEEPLSFNGLVKGLSKLNIDLQDKDVRDFITMDDGTTAEYSESILEEVEATNNDVEPTNMPGTSEVHYETNEEDFGE